MNQEYTQSLEVARSVFNVTQETIGTLATVAAAFDAAELQWRDASDLRVVLVDALELKRVFDITNTPVNEETINEFGAFVADVVPEPINPELYVFPANTQSTRFSRQLNLWALSIALERHQTLTDDRYFLCQEIDKRYGFRGEGPWDHPFNFRVDLAYGSGPQVERAAKYMAIPFRKMLPRSLILDAPCAEYDRLPVVQ